MAAPKQSDVIRRVLEENAHAVRVPEPELEDRRRSFLPAFIAAMPVDERGNWGVLLKTDKTPGYIPSDILMWRPTSEIIDVSSADQMPDGSWVIVPTWTNHGAIGKAKGTEGKIGKWIWLDVKQAAIPPLPGVPHEPPAPPEDGKPPIDDEAEFWRRLIEDFDRMCDGIDKIAAAMTTLAKAAARFG